MSVQQFRNFACIELNEEIDYETISKLFIDLKIEANITDLLLFQYPEQVETTSLRISFVDFSHFVYSSMNDVMSPDKLKEHQVDLCKEAS